ncbi:MAG: hypothetical protein KIT67_25810 [Alphaproteobacteria bacterium]|nr:hypothetical protein [Alphaproteobacteria bacterium]
MAYHAWAYGNPLAEVMARQGYCRRLRILVHCVQTAFATIPPASNVIPSDEPRSVCTICLQAFVLNVFGCMDNLAQIWVKERGIKRSNGKEIPPLLMGLGAKCEDVRESLSRDFQDYLDSSLMKGWFAYLEDYRHALAHRIPLYIPPHAVGQSNAAAYNELENRMREARHRLDMDEHDRLEAEQLQLCSFLPVATHAWDETTRPILFHSQMLADYETVVDLGWRMLRELDPSTSAAR